MNHKLQKIKVLIADDHPIFRRGLGHVIESAAQLKLVGEAANGEIALKLIETEMPDVAVLDVDMPVLDGIEVARRAQKKFPHLKTVFLTMHKDRQILNAVKELEVKGYVLKDSAIAEIVNCIVQVTAGKIYLSPEISALLLQDDKTTKPTLTENSPVSKLTASERQILALVAQSKTNKEIAAELFLSVRTVENHRFNICAKFGLKGNHALVKYALENKESILGSI
jgi:DNA-binding NarL/FixJ family response regulator